MYHVAMVYHVSSEMYHVAIVSLTQSRTKNKEKNNDVHNLHRFFCLYKELFHRCSNRKSWNQVYRIPGWRWSPNISSWPSQCIDRFSAYYKYKVSVNVIYDNHPHKMQKRNQCLFLRIKISLMAHFNNPILVEFRVFTDFLFWKLHNKNAK